MKINISNYEVLIELHKRRRTTEMVACYHCGRSFLIAKQQMRVYNFCNSCG